MTGRVAEKSVIVFGAGSVGPGWGNGKAAAVLFAREGGSVLCVDRNGAAAAETAAIIAEEGFAGAAFEADVTDPKAVAHAVSEAKRRYGGVDIVHFNVGISRPGGIMDAAPDDWATVFSVNLESALHVARASIPAMRERGGGAFVFISSIAAIATGGYQYVSYEASKAALNRLSRSLAVAHAAEGIRSNVVLPGLIDTPHVQAMVAGKVTRADDLATRRAAAPPMKRQGTAWDVAEAAVFLASDAAGYITGAELVVDGGLTLTVPAA